MSLYKKLSIVENVSYIQSWKIAQQIKNLYFDKKISLIECSYSDHWQQGIYPLNLNNEKEWQGGSSTFTLQLVKIKRKILLKVTAYQTNNFDGHREKLNWVAKFNISANELSLFREYIDDEFAGYCKQLYLEELELIANNRVNEIMKSLLA